ncbi:MAG TPA: OsmC family protein [Polyangia bacterium]|nr:OsmC family protein [Polyangia bacterium]
MATTTVESENGYAQRIESGGHALTADEPAEGGGTDTGPAPYGLLLAALGACTSITLRMYAERKGWALGRIHVVLRLSKTHDGGDQIERDVSFGAPLSEEQRARIADIVEKTPVTKTIKAGAPIRTRLL